MMPIVAEPAMTRLTLVIRACIALVCVLTGLWAARSGAIAGTSTDFAVDVDTAVAGVQTSHTVAVGETFPVRVVLTSFGAESYGAYQVRVEYNGSIVEATGLPDNWGDAPDGDNGGNLLEFGSGALCDPVPTENSLATFDDVPSVTATCAELNFSTTIAATGDLIELRFSCIAPGEASFGLSTIENTFLLDTAQLPSGQVVTYGDTFGAASVTCEGDAPASTPGATQTSASVGSSPTAEAGETPQPQTTPPGGGDTPTNGSAGGAEDDDDSNMTWLWVTIAAVAGAVVIAGLAYSRFRSSR
jgi:hypothetical protein